MKRLWLTYAWADNEDSDVDFVAQEIARGGVSVEIDRTHLIAGKRLWPQIDNAISNPEVSDGWAIYATAASLQSEPCQEELAIALDRALRTRGSTYPLIGIFPAPIDRSLVPSAIATRLYVNLQDPTWSQQVVGSLTGADRGKPAEVRPFVSKLHRDEQGKCWFECRPRAGIWDPIVLMVPTAEFGECFDGPTLGPPGWPPEFSVHAVSEKRATFDGTSFTGVYVHQRLDNLSSVYLGLKRVPSRVLFGSPQSFYVLELQEFPHP